MVTWVGPDAKPILRWMGAAGPTELMGGHRMKGMEINGKPIVYHIGYQHFSTITAFVAKMFVEGVTLVVDVRSFPRSCKKGFDGKAMMEGLAERCIMYQWEGKEMGGKSTCEEWDRGCLRVMKLAETEQVCLVCLETRWEDCHRRHLCRILNGFKVHTVNL